MKPLALTALLLLLCALICAGPGRVCAGEQGEPVGAGLSAEAAVELALQKNPSLRAARKQRALAEGEIVSATAVENPSLQLQLLHVQAGAQLGWGGRLSWTPPQPVEWSAKRAQARAHLSEVRFEIAEKEWALAIAVRTAHVTILELQEQERLHGEALSLRQRMAALVRTQLGRGRATRLELNLAELSAQRALRELDEIELRRTQAQAQLQALLGILSVEPIVVMGPLPSELGDPARLDPAALIERALQVRPALKAAHARITQGEQAVRIETTRRFPWIELSGRYRQNSSTANPHDVQLGIELSLPVFNTNAGPLQVARAQKEQEQATLEAQVHTLMQGIYAACAELKLRTRTLGRYRQQVLPVLVEHERLMETAARGAEIDMVALLGSEESVLRGRRELVDLRLAYRRAWLALEGAVGVPLQEVLR